MIGAANTNSPPFRMTEIAACSYRDGNMAQPRRKQEFPKPRPMRMPRHQHQPSKAELDTEIDMPDLFSDQARAAFMRPFRFTST